MPSSIEALKIVFLILPGFVTGWIIRALTTKVKKDFSYTAIESIFYAFLIYSIHSLCFPDSIKLIIEESITGTQKIYAFKSENIIVLFLLSVVAGLLISFLITNDIVTKILRKLRITTFSTRDSIWSDIFSEYKTYVLVEFQGTEEKLIGWPEHFSDTPEESTLFLSDASWIKDDGTSITIDGPGILLTKESKIKRITYLQTESSEDTTKTTG